MKAMSIAPTRLPSQTTIKFRSIPPAVMRLERTPMIMRQFPVKSSLPAMSTMARPAGNTAPLTRRAAEPASVAEPTPAARPPTAMNMPARIASTNMRPNGSFALVSQAFK